MKLDLLNPAQRDAVMTERGPLLVLAGAGTGKTRVITYRIAYLIQRKIAPERILAVTFTNKAAREMQERSGQLLGKRKKGKKPLLATFHSLCLQILRRHITKLGYPSRFAIYDRGDQDSLARGVLQDLKLGSEALRPGDFLGCVSFWKTRGYNPSQAIAAARTDLEHLAASGYRRYQDALKTLGAVDFDDLLRHTELIFQQFPEVLAEEAGRFDHLMIDEYQDTNGIQYRIVKALADRHRNLCVVGDDDQSIYGWRGAEVQHILNFKHDWPEAKIVRLESNYRSREPILVYANRLIAFNSQRHPKTLRSHRGAGVEPRMVRFTDENEEAAGVVKEIREQMAARGTKPGDYAVLFRTNEQPRPFEVEFRRQNVPYLLQGSQSFYDRKEVRDLLAYMKVVVYPQDDIALLRILNTPPRGIGQTTTQKLTQQSVEQDRPLWEIIQQQVESEELSPKLRESLKRFLKLFERPLQRLKYELPLAPIRELFEKANYREEIKRQYKDPQEQETRSRSIEEVLNAIGNYQDQASKPNLMEFLDQMALADRDIQKPRQEQNTQAVRLLTLHSAKGLEFPYVYLVGMEEGILPHKRSLAENERDLAEERRLCYVGVTRAQEELTITLTAGRRKWGKIRPSVPSRFLFEMRGDADNPHLLALRRQAAQQAYTSDMPPQSRRKKSGQPTKKAFNKAPSKKAPPRSINKPTAKKRKPPQRPRRSY
ncbi:ATP-dependent DNA helicase UvrD/PcrA [Planctomycetales bacterium 10988]|nr:ATP-dependent DNA helicase UvrD/PcrA [Planctomycetales bacterium 10988]